MNDASQDALRKVPEVALVRGSVQSLADPCDLGPSLLDTRGYRSRRRFGPRPVRYGFFRGSNLPKHR
jgi:hypothetical protein